MRPRLVDPPKFGSPDDYPEGTSFEAGHLTAVNSGWRRVRPEIDGGRCTGCLLCYLHCPDGTIIRNGRTVAVDYDFCKGCGICAKMCKAGAIKMEKEHA
ncbi:MAG: 4Fe-4S binding protein [Candidatus Methanoplasma sp.]|jgi:2-oxoacid:acceptor oxidoreductase delta subunit (pyruvate/2-ketoisovalerate family)|nr:4Fe-4S binding protein [Candidatus Methanoplasma sp.]